MTLTEEKLKAGRFFLALLTSRMEKSDNEEEVEGGGGINWDSRATFGSISWILHGVTGARSLALMDTSEVTTDKLLLKS